MEQVPNGVVLRLLDKYASETPKWLDYEVVCMAQYGVPQHRKRVIAGSPWLVEKLRDGRQVLGEPRVKDAVRTMPKEAVGMKGHYANQGVGKMKKASAANPVFKKPVKQVELLRRVHRGGVVGPAPTVQAGNTLRWTGEAGHTIRYLTTQEHATLQTFPPHYKFPYDTPRVAQKLCGNSVPPLFAKVLMSQYRLPVPLNHIPDAHFPARPPSPSLAL